MTSGAQTRRHTNPAKAFLSQYIPAKARYASLYREINRWRDTLTDTSSKINADMIHGGGVSDRMAAVVACIADAESKLAGEAAEISAILSSVLEAINSVPDEMQRTVLTLRYVEGLDWISIAEKIGYEISNTYIIHGRALVEVNKRIKKKLCTKL